MFKVFSTDRVLPQLCTVHGVPVLPIHETIVGRWLTPIQLSPPVTWPM